MRIKQFSDMNEDIVYVKYGQWIWQAMKNWPYRVEDQQSSIKDSSRRDGTGGVRVLWAFMVSKSIVISLLSTIFQLIECRKLFYDNQTILWSDWRYCLYRKRTMGMVSNERIWPYWVENQQSIIQGQVVELGLKGYPAHFFWVLQTIPDFLYVPSI